MNKLQSSLGKYLLANFTPRRIIILLMAVACFGASFFSMMGWLNLSLPWTIGVLVAGLLLFEWAG